MTIGQEKGEFAREVSNSYFGRPSDYLSNLLFILNPAPDNITASNIMCLVEIGLALSMFSIAQRVRVAKMYQTFLLKFVFIQLGLNLLYCGGGQLMTNKEFGEDTILAADAKRQRLKLIAENKPVSWWFGPKQFERIPPLERMELQERAMQQRKKIMLVDARKMLLKGTALAVENDKYLKSTIIPELRKLRGGAITTTEKPDLTIGDFDLEGDFDHVWFDLLDPWKELWQEVHLSINFVPKWNFIESTNGVLKTDKTIGEEEGLQKKEEHL